MECQSDYLEKQKNFIYVFLTLIFVYSAWRLYSTTVFCCSRKKTIRYQSRIFFRIFFILHIVCDLIKYIIVFNNQNDHQNCYVHNIMTLFTQLFNSISMIFLVRSILDFAQFTRGPKIFYEKFWALISIPPMLLYWSILVCFHATNMKSFDPHNTTITIVTNGIYILYNLVLIVIPGLFFIYHLYQSDIVNEFKKTVYFGLTFYIFIILFDIVSYVISILAFYEPDSSESSYPSEILKSIYIILDIIM
ncbi:hypothetical protein TRFO_31352 [Tritrichomonas foetus]|uniref:Uncharacterized protein n=1 Tax=Tritrichomonas foetus TaxID=1144522 RepID=A0A1J4JSJ9_9EUKA|nr:hypothetical protein TRFO_31352 [Tritrichomonas foetus]|eukprot:OHT01738.1 hypothetical protein TRFO_31352 [Tritrichomonas foetus]